MRSTFLTLIAVLGATTTLAEEAKPDGYFCDSYDIGIVIGFFARHGGPQTYAPFCSRIPQEWATVKHPTPHTIELMRACDCVLREYALLSSSSSSTLSTEVASATDPAMTVANIGTTLTTSSSTEATSTSATTKSPAHPTITNILSNGDFASYDYTSPQNINYWSRVGMVRLVSRSGYKGDRSRDNLAIELSTSVATSAKMRLAREATGTAGIEQYVPSFDKSSDYVLRLFYQVRSNLVADTCTMNAYLGGEHFDSTAPLPVVSTDKEEAHWYEYTATVQTTRHNGYFNLQLSCTQGGSAKVMVDSVFLAKKEKLSGHEKDAVRVFP